MSLSLSARKYRYMNGVYNLMTLNEYSMMLVPFNTSLNGVFKPFIAYIESCNELGDIMEMGIVKIENGQVGYDHILEFECTGIHDSLREEIGLLLNSTIYCFDVMIPLPGFSVDEFDRIRSQHLQSQST